MTNVFSERTLEYANSMDYKGTLLYHLIDNVENDKKSKEEAIQDYESDTRIASDHRLKDSWFSYSHFQKEVRKNIIDNDNEFVLRKYLHYLIKIYRDLFIVSASNRTKLKRILELNMQYRGDELKSYQKGITEDDYIILLATCQSVLTEITGFQSSIGEIIRKEFGISVDDWEKLTIEQTSRNGKEYTSHKVPDLKYLGLIYNASYEDIISQTLEPSSATTENTVTQRIVWTGKLKEFAELIDQLQEKSWIKINDRELKPTVESLCKVFDFSATKKKEDSNTSASLMQYLKESEREDKIYAKRYTKKFDSILPNTK